MQHIVLVGINYKTTDVSSREKLSERKLFERISAKYFPTLCEEFIVLATCNRIEVIFVTAYVDETIKIFERFFNGLKMYTYQDKQAVRHIYGVTSGIDSMILGEYEILSQIKKSYQLAHEKKTVGPILHQLFQNAIRVGKRVRHETRIGNGITSVAHGAVLLAKKQIDDLAKSRVLVIGAGVIAQRIMKHLREEGVVDIVIINRTYTKAKSLAKLHSGRAGKIKDMKKFLLVSDIVISATSSPKFILSCEVVKKIMKKRAMPLSIIDIAVPRDVESSVKDIVNVHLYNVDGIQDIVNTNIKRRKNELTKIKKIIENEVNIFFTWILKRKSIPLLVHIQEYADIIRNEELQKALQKLSHLHLSDDEKNIITTLSKRVESKLLAKPFQNIKRLSSQKNGTRHLETIREVFDVTIPTS